MTNDIESFKKAWTEAILKVVDGKLNSLLKNKQSIIAIAEITTIDYSSRRAIVTFINSGQLSGFIPYPANYADNEISVGQRALVVSPDPNNTSSNSIVSIMGAPFNLFSPKAININQGWVDPGETWTYSSVDDPTGVITTTGDATNKYTVGMRIKFTNGGSVINGIITKITTNTITFLHEIDPTDSLALVLMANSAITANYYSVDKAPFGFPLDPNKWTVYKTDASTRLFTATKNTWSVPTSSTATINLPIGIWRMSGKVYARATTSGGTITFVSAGITFSTTTNTETNPEYTLKMETAVGAIVNVNQYMDTRPIITATAKTTWNLLFFFNTDATASGATSGFNSAAYIRAECAYL